jgi:hypothetical protein
MGFLLKKSIIAGFVIVREVIIWFSIIIYRGFSLYCFCCCVLFFYGILKEKYSEGENLSTGEL